MVTPLLRSTESTQQRGNRPPGMPVRGLIVMMMPHSVPDGGACRSSKTAACCWCVSLVKSPVESGGSL